MYGDEGGYFGDAGGYGRTDGGAGGPSTTPKAGGGKGDSKRAQNVLPVCSHQIRQSTESGVQIAGQEFHLVTMVGRVVEIANTSMKTTYTIEDDRGMIDAVHWSEQDAESDKPPVVEDAYVRVYGSIRSQEGKKFLMVFSIKPVKTFNELTSHRLEVAVIAKKIESSANKLGGDMETANDMNGGGLGNSLMDMGNQKMAPMSNLQKQVFLVIKGFTDPGVHIDEIRGHLAEKPPQALISKAVEDLMNEGHIYSSVDEYHYLCTES